MAVFSFFSPMSFKVRKIKHRRSQKGPGLSGKKKLLVALLSLLVGGGFLYAHGSRGGATVARFLPFSDLSQDEEGRTNILFLGVAGESEEGGNLSDSIMLASIDPSGPSVSFLSLPRDLFVSSKIGDRKVNEIYAAARYKNKKNSQKGLEVIKDAIARFADIDVHYGVVVNFHVFQELVDGLGGVDIFVQEDIVDPFYPDADYGYQMFLVREGWQHFDGSTALKYARSRKTTSDYNRAQRQQQVLMAIKNRAAEMHLLSDFGKLREMYRAFRENVITDLGITQVVAMAELAAKLDYSNAVHAVLNDDPAEKGGFLYTPAQEFFGGQFVLLPENLKDTQTFVSLVLKQPDILLENAQLAVLNGSRIDGKASETAARLRRMGLHVIEIGNYDSERPVFEHLIKDLKEGGMPKTKAFLSTLFEARVLSPEETTAPIELVSPEGLVDLELILGMN